MSSKSKVVATTSAVAPAKCGFCGKTPEQFWVAADGLVFCNADCYAAYHGKLAKETKRFEAAT